MCLVERQQVGKTRENHFTNVESHRAAVAHLAVDYVVTYFAALSLHVHTHTGWADKK